MNETLVKYLAGLLDADGSLSYNFRKDPRGGGFYYVGLMMKLCASNAIDKKGFVASLPEMTGIGTLVRDGRSSQFAIWAVTKRTDLEKLLPRLIKHMVIKAKHWQWLLDQWRQERQGKRDGWTCTAERREALTAESKASRQSRVGPIRPKNHPTWAWLAGYLDGDGTYHYRSYPTKQNGRQWAMNVSAVAHVNDIHVLQFLEKSFGGRIQPQGQSDNVMIWIRSVGYQNKDFALGFLPNLAKHSRMKRDKIDAIISHHRQRLSVPGVDRNYCKIEGCEREAHGHKMCQMHYLRWYRHGDPHYVSNSLNAS